MREIILASASPRRKKLLKKAGIKFKTVESGLKEYFDPKLKPYILAGKLSLKKAKAAAPRFKDALIISADTLVAIDNKVLGKPKNEKDARKMLEILSGKMHLVITGFTICDVKTNKCITKSVKSKVYFNKVSKKDIDNYIFSRKPFDKAGGYGIQELPKVFIRKIEGDYDNVVGLPIKALLRELKKFGVEVL